MTMTFTRRVVGAVLTSVAHDTAGVSVSDMHVIQVVVRLMHYLHLMSCV